MRQLLLASLLLWWPSRALADSDGYYCHAEGVVAWETSLASATSEHILHIVRFSPSAGILPTERVVLPEFQVHAISCGPAHVELVGWTTRYRVDIAVVN